MDRERTRGMPECAGEKREHGRGGRDKKRVKGEKRRERGEDWQTGSEIGKTVREVA